MVTLNHTPRRNISVWMPRDRTLGDIYYTELCLGDINYGDT